LDGHAVAFGVLDFHKMRITGGKAGGIPLKAPKGTRTRPATDRLRESVFSSLGTSIEGCKVADLFAGTGSYGLEALSRGAASSTFFESDHAALTCLRQNLQATIRSCNLDTDVVQVVARDVFKLDSNTPSYDLIFLDPPYDTIAEDLQRIFEKAINPIALARASVIVELPGYLEPKIKGWKILRRIGKASKDKPTALIYERTHCHSPIQPF
jgi:16S rRNA (guanine966-N2)-methyltransferase